VKRGRCCHALLIGESDEKLDRKNEFNFKNNMLYLLKTMRLKNHFLPKRKNPQYFRDLALKGPTPEAWP